MQLAFVSETLLGWSLHLVYWSRLEDWLRRVLAECMHVLGVCLIPLRVSHVLSLWKLLKAEWMTKLPGGILTLRMHTVCWLRIGSTEVILRTCRIRIRVNTAEIYLLLV